MFCTQCGNEIIETSRFCQVCGHQLSVADTQGMLNSAPSVNEPNERYVDDQLKSTENQKEAHQSSITGTNDVEKKNGATLFQEMWAGIGISLVGFYLALSNHGWGWGIFGGLFFLGAISNLWTGFGGNITIQTPKNKIIKNIFEYLVCCIVATPLVLFNPSETDHRKFLLRELKDQVSERPLGEFANALGSTEYAFNNAEIKYNNLYAFSTTTNPKGEVLTFGILGFVKFVHDK